MALYCSCYWNWNVGTQPHDLLAVLGCQTFDWSVQSVSCVLSSAAPPALGAGSVGRESPSHTKSTVLGHGPMVRHYRYRKSPHRSLNGPWNPDPVLQVGATFHTTRLGRHLLY